MIRAALLVVALLALAAAPADAAVTRKKAMWGPVTVDGVSQFPTYADLGVGIFQYTLPWDVTAPDRPGNPADPADPAYHWPAEIDQAIAEGEHYGIQVALAVGSTPRWANKGRARNFAPTDPNDYATFMAAAAKRYPAVRHWLVWGEPTKNSNFRPRKGAGPRYARILDAAYGALKAVDRRNLVIGGNTFTVGDSPPLRWIQQLKLPNGRPPRMDLFGHNPFSARRPDLNTEPLGGGFADFSDLDTLARWIDRYLKRGTKLFLSEFTLPTGHANWEFNFWMTPKTQATWLTDALKITRRWSRIYTLGYLGLYDDPVREDGRQVERGLLERDGTHKPAYDTFRRG